MFWLEMMPWIIIVISNNISDMYNFIDYFMNTLPNVYRFKILKLNTQIFIEARVRFPQLHLHASHPS